MSDSMAATLGNHYVNYYPSRDWECTSLQCDFKAKNFSDAMEHVADVLAANGYGKLTSVQLAARDRPESMEVARAKVRADRLAAQAETIRRAKEDAFEEGRRAGWPSSTPNPYRRPE